MSVKYTAIVSGCTTTGSTSCNSNNNNNSRWLVAYLVIRDVLHLALNLTRRTYLNIIMYFFFLFVHNF